jgi:uncharacterized protein (TIGR02118 family)
MIKITALLIRRPELTHEQFMHHWVEVHAPLVDALPGLRRYVQSHILGEQAVPVPTTGVALDGIAELWFDDRAAFDQAFASPEGQRLAADGALFIGRISFFIFDEKVMIPRS